MDHLTTLTCCGVDPCSFIIEFDSISSDHSTLFPLGHVYMEISHIWMGVVHLCLCHGTETIYVFHYTSNDYIRVQQVVSMT